MDGFVYRLVFSLSILFIFASKNKTMKMPRKQPQQRTISNLFVVLLVVDYLYETVNALKRYAIRVPS